MPLKIKRVIPKSLADLSGLKATDTIIEINNNPINDFIGLQFHTAEENLRFLIEDSQGERREVFVKQDWSNELGIELEDYKVKKCINNCVFCFIDQMPPNLRESLYVKDDDYLFSFVFGNYISLNNMNEKEFQRIIAERISPLYISVHATNPVLRKQMMRYKHDVDLMGRLRQLSDSGIGYHTQLVLIPELNDGDELIRSIDDLISDDLNTFSIGVVPAGLTKHRKNLPFLRKHTQEEAMQTIAIIDRFRKTSGFENIYASDEFYIKADLELPDRTYYNDFCQLENGIGMLRLTLDNWRRKKKGFISFLEQRSLLLVTGQLAAPYIKMIEEDINKLSNNNLASSFAVINDFFGETVTVSGLITFTDIRSQLADSQLPEIIAFSSNMFNTDGFTLDGVKQSDLPAMLNRDVLIVDELWEEYTLLTNKQC